VHWVNAAEPAGMKAEIAACGAKMGLRFWPEKLDEQVNATLRAWEQAGERRLVVLDGLEEEAILQEWLPVPGQRLSAERALSQ
jgi:hypothetical protein